MSGTGTFPDTIHIYDSNFRTRSFVIANHNEWKTIADFVASPYSDPPAARAFKERIYNYPPPPAGESEDCLYLNVYTPAIGKSQNEPKTVMMWFYGGNLQLGSNAIDMYDGTSFAANQDVVVVAANYRTNGTFGPLPFFGFCISPQGTQPS